MFWYDKENLVVVTRMFWNLFRLKEIAICMLDLGWEVHDLIRK